MAYISFKGHFKQVQLLHTRILKVLLKVIYKLLHDSPVHRADYISVTGSMLFPLSFCATRWVEDKKVADKAVEIWVNICKIIDLWQKLVPSKRPKRKSYTTVVTAVNDQLATAKRQFFSFIAMILQPFLELYQSDIPMIPYMFDDIINSKNFDEVFYQSGCC